MLITIASYETHEWQYTHIPPSWNRCHQHTAWNIDDTCSVRTCGSNHVDLSIRDYNHTWILDYCLQQLITMTQY